jgi:hypothetical protein
MTMATLHSHYTGNQWPATRERRWRRNSELSRAPRFSLKATSLTIYPSNDTTAARSLSESVDIVHLFTRKRTELATKLRAYRRRLRDDTVVWVSWPKKSSKVPTDITEDVIREVALPLGFVDVKVCAVDEIWSGLKLVIRRELRE